MHWCKYINFASCVLGTLASSSAQPPYNRQKMEDRSENFVKFTKSSTQR